MKKLQKLTLKELSNSVEVIDEKNAAILVGGSSNGDGGNNDSISFDDYLNLDSAGQWSGGYVDGWGYIGPTCVGFNTSNGDSLSVTSHYQYQQSQIESTMQIIGNAIAGAVTFTVYSTIGEFAENETRRINAACSANNISGNDMIYILYDSNGMSYSVYNGGGTMIYQTDDF
jgi:natural product precursor